MTPKYSYALLHFSTRDYSCTYRALRFNNNNIATQTRVNIHRHMLQKHILECANRVVGRLQAYMLYTDLNATAQGDYLGSCPVRVQNARFSSLPFGTEASGLPRIVFVMRPGCARTGLAVLILYVAILHVAVVMGNRFSMYCIMTG